MSELKAGVIVTPHNEGMSFNGGSSRIAVTEGETEFYIKSEVDEVIAELNKKLRWRKCSEEMPEEDEGVLFSDGKYIYKGCWTTWDGGHSDFSYETFLTWVEDLSAHEYDFNEIKYWMPLPKAPEAK